MIEKQDFMNETIDLVIQLLKDNKHEEACQKVERVACETLKIEGQVTQIKQQEKIKQIVLLDKQIIALERELRLIEMKVESRELKRIYHLISDLKKKQARLKFEKKQLAYRK